MKWLVSYEYNYSAVDPHHFPSSEIRSNVEIVEGDISIWFVDHQYKSTKKDKPVELYETWIITRIFSLTKIED